MPLGVNATVAQHGILSRTQIAMKATHLELRFQILSSLVGNEHLKITNICNVISVIVIPLTTGAGGNSVQNNDQNTAVIAVRDEFFRL